MPSFFFSYSSQDAKNSYGLMEKFFEQLYSALEIAHGRVEKPFFAPEIIKPAEKWRNALAGGLNSSQVLVCLQSASYFQSEYCGKELEVFLKRRKRFLKLHREEPPDCIIPVLWYQLPGPAPKVVPTDFQGKKPSDSRVPIGEDGLLDAMLNDTTPNKESSFRYALSLAARISNLLGRNVGDRELPALPGPLDLEATPSAFDLPEWPVPDLDVEQGTGQSSVTFVYPSTMDPQKLPFAPPPPNAVISAAGFAKSREWIFQGIGLDAQGDFLERIKRAQGWKSPVILMFTETVLGDRDLLAKLKGLPGNGIATMVLSGEITADFPENLRANAIKADRERFDEILTEKLRRLRQALIDEATIEIPRSTQHPTVPGF